MALTPTREYIALAHGGTYALPAFRPGWGVAILGDDEEATWFRLHVDGTVDLLDPTAGVRNADLNGFFCLFNGTVKNNLGSKKNLYLDLFVSDGSDTLADDATATLNSPALDWGWAMLGDHAAFAMYYRSYAGSFIIQGDLNARTVDLDGFMCLFSDGIKNRLGAASAYDQAGPSAQSLPQSVADGGTIVIPVTGPGWITVMSESGDYVFAHYDSAAAAVNVFHCSANARNFSAPGCLCVYGSGGDLIVENNLGATWDIHVKAEMAPDINDVEIDDYSDRLVEVHLASPIRITGEGFDELLKCRVDGQDCDVTVNGETSAEIVLPIFAFAAWKDLVFYYADPEVDAFTERNAVRVSADGYNELRAHLPPGRYTPDPANLLNVALAAIGQEIDRNEAAARDVVALEIHPETTERLIHRLEQKYGISPNPGDSLADRRDRLVMLATRVPRITVPYLEAIVDAILAGVGITENSPWSDYGSLTWQYQVYEPSPGFLSTTDYGSLLESLVTHGPGYALPAIGAAGFVVGLSRVGRDFVAAE